MNLAFKGLPAILLAAGLSACGTMGSGSSDKLTEHEKSVLMASYQNLSNGDLIASWARGACGGAPPSKRDYRRAAGNDRSGSDRCRYLSNPAAFILANQGKYAEASKHMSPPLYRSGGLELGSLTGVIGTPQKDIRIFNRDYLAFLIADGMKRGDVKELMYAAYIRSADHDWQGMLESNPTRNIDTPIRSFSLKNFPIDAERLDGPEAGRQATVFLQKIMLPLKQAKKNQRKIRAQIRAQASTNDDSTRVFSELSVLYEYAIKEAQKLNLDDRYIRFLGEQNTHWANAAKTSEKVQLLQ